MILPISLIRIGPKCFEKRVANRINNEVERRTLSSYWLNLSLQLFQNHTTGNISSESALIKIIKRQEFMELLPLIRYKLSVLTVNHLHFELQYWAT